jgi:hypothetical protein
MSPVQPKLPIALKLVFTAYLAILVPYYWIAYTPWNFLFFCDIALLLTLLALWTEDPLVASMAAVGITVPQLIWVTDFLARGNLTGTTTYMFDSRLSLFIRGLSSFHLWLPFLLIWIVWRLGYDRRGLLAWILVTWVVLPLCYFVGPPPPAPPSHPNRAVNINFVYGLSYEKPQTWMAPMLWLTLLMLAHPLLFALPAHAAFRTFIRGAASGPSRPPRDQAETEPSPCRQGTL